MTLILPGGGGGIYGSYSHYSRYSRYNECTGAGHSSTSCLLSAVTLYNVPGDRGGGPVASATPLMASSSDTAEPQLGGEIGPILPHLPTQRRVE